MTWDPLPQTVDGAPVLGPGPHEGTLWAASPDPDVAGVVVGDMGALEQMSRATQATRTTRAARIARHGAKVSEEPTDHRPYVTAVLHAGDCTDTNGLATRDWLTGWPQRDVAVRAALADDPAAITATSARRRMITGVRWCPNCLGPA